MGCDGNVFCVLIVRIVMWDGNFGIWVFVRFGVFESIVVDIDFVNNVFNFDEFDVFKFFEGSILVIVIL